MIVYDLQCSAGAHRFEGWFASSDDFARQQERGLVSCPICGSCDVLKAVQAPNVGRKGNQVVAAPAMGEGEGKPLGMTNTPPALPPEAVEALRAIATAQAEALKKSKWVGNEFADAARAMHYGDRDAEPIHGQASPDQARDLHEEGIAVAPILFPYVPPEEAN